MTRLSVRTETLTVGGQKVQFASNVPLSGSVVVDRVVVVQHGIDRNHLDYANRMAAGAKKAKVDGVTAVVAPLFDTSWSSEAWKQGGPSKKGLSSFTVMDVLLAVLADRGKFPHITRTVLAGHSAGAQFTQRYAVFGNGPADQYLVCNPSSFMYLDSWRPASTKGCPTFGFYKYGMEKRPGYVAALSPSQAISRYTSRTVLVANGDQDSTDNGDLDQNCEAMAQGKNRLTRGKAFSDRIKLLYPDAPHSYLVVPGVAHSSTAMFAAPLMRPVLFGVK